MYQSIRRIATVADIQLRYLRSRPYTVFRAVVFPVTEVLVIALVTQFLTTGTVLVDAGSFMVIGTIAWILISEFQRGFVLAFFDYLYEHSLPLVWTTPLRTWEWFVGTTISATALAVPTGAVITLTAVSLAIPVGGLGWWVVPSIVIGAMLAFALALLVMTCVLRWGFGATELAWGIGAMLSPLSGAFVPVSELPTVLQPIAQILPTTMLFTAMRSAWGGAGSPAGVFALAFVAALASIVVMVAVLRRALTTFRRKVKVTRFIG